MPDANEFCRAILPEVSRTFALSIRRLRGDLGDAVCTSYLICRIADTIEDEPTLGAGRKAELFDALDRSLERADAVTAFSAQAHALGGDPAHVKLVRNAEIVFAAYWQIADAPRGSIRRWVGEMIVGMRRFSLAYPRGVRIQTLDEYKEYCYYVAGTVGYLLTDLWYEYSSTIDEARYRILRDRCRAFAEALQTVNILKDVARDAEHENSIYIPQELLAAHGSDHETLLAVDRATQTNRALDALVQLAWHDLDEAKAYVLAIPRRDVSIRLSCALPLLFAYATLRDLTRNPGALARREVVKISRSEVKSLTALSTLVVLSNRMMAWLVERARVGRVRSV